MDPIIAKTLELAHAIMDDSRFVAYRTATQNNDEDATLQDLIGKFNLARMNLSNAAGDKEMSAEKKGELQKEVSELYEQIMATESMQAYQEAQTVMNGIIKQINAVISGTIAGQIPEEIDIEASCSGDCASCGGSCH